MRMWLKPDALTKLGITVSDVVNAVQSQNTVNPAGQMGGEPAPKGQEFTYSVRAQGRLITPEQFGDIIIRENPSGGAVRVKDVARIELGAQSYTLMGRLNGKPAALLAVYQLPGSNAVNDSQAVQALMAQLKKSFPSDIDYVIALDQTKAVTEGMREIVLTLGIALVLVIIVVYLFLQGWRATLIPLLAVPVSLVGTFAFFPLFGFSVNTLSMFGLVLAIALLIFGVVAVFFGAKLPSGFLPDEDQGYVYINLQLPNSASLERTEKAAHAIEDILAEMPGVRYTTSIIGFSLLSYIQTSYNAFFFVTLKPWSDRKDNAEQLQAIKQRLNQQLTKLPQGAAFSFSPPAIPGVGTSGGFTFVL